MAEAAVQAPTAANPQKYFCHKCSVSVDLSPELPELTCPKCESGFVEEITRDLQAEQSANESTPQAMFLSGPSLPSLFSSLMSPPSDDDFDEDSDDEEEEESTSDRLLMRGPRRRRRNRRRSGLLRHNIPWPSAEPRGFPRFIEDLLRDLTGGNSGQVPALLPFLPPLFHGDPRDYAWGADGLDNAITQLLNQWESPGSPPASNEDIDNLPVVTIAQEHIDSERQCSVCMEDFQLEDVVRSLPCHHLFHTDCISPWLRLHNTCPICRKTLGMPAVDEEQTNEREATDATDSSSTDSSDNIAVHIADTDSDSSDEEVHESAATASSPAADGGNDCVADGSTAADVPDCTVWDVWPESSTGISVNSRQRSSSSSSSEYSSL